MDLAIVQPNDRIMRLMARDPEQARLAHLASLQKAISKGVALAEAVYIHIHINYYHFDIYFNQFNQYII